MANLGLATDVLSAMITPALLISASGTLVLSTSNRLSRVVERVRVLARDAEQLPSSSRAALSDEKRALIARQLSALAERALILRSALAALYTAIGFLVATSIGVGFMTTLGAELHWPVIVLAMMGVFALFYGSVLLVREGRLAIGSTLEEMGYAQKLIGVDAPKTG